MVDAYLEHWTSTEVVPRIGLSRSIYVAPTRAEAIAEAEEGIRRHAQLMASRGIIIGELPVEELLVRADVHIGSPDDAIASLHADPLMQVATDLILQVHPIDPSHERRCVATADAADVAPALGWRPDRALATTPLRESARRGMTSSTTRIN